MIGLKLGVKTFLHWHLVIVGMVAAAFIVFALVLEPEPNIPSIASWVFAVSGTMVALVIPAAGLGGQYITRIAEYWLNRVANTEEKARPGKAKIGLEFITEAKNKAMHAWRGSMYVFCALFLSSIAIFSPRITLCSCIVLMDYGVLGIALGFLMVGACLFFPFAMYIYRLDTLEEVIKVLEGTADKK